MELTWFYMYSDWSLLAMRVILGVIFLAHGLPKLKNLKGTGQWFGSQGFKPGIFWATFVAFVEVFGALAFLSGFWMELFAILFVGEFAVIILWKLITNQK